MQNYTLLVALLANLAFVADQKLIEESGPPAFYAPGDFFVAQNSLLGVKLFTWRETLRMARNFREELKLMAFCEKMIESEICERRKMYHESILM